MIANPSGYFAIITDQSLLEAAAAISAATLKPDRGQTVLLTGPPPPIGSVQVGIDDVRVITARRQGVAARAAAASWRCQTVAAVSTTLRPCGRARRCRHAMASPIGTHPADRDAVVVRDDLTTIPTATGCAARRPWSLTSLWP